MGTPILGNIHMMPHMLTCTFKPIYIYMGMSQNPAHMLHVWNIYQHLP